MNTSLTKHIIENNGIIDHIANYCLRPLHGLLHLSTGVVRVFRVDLCATTRTVSGKEITLEKVDEHSYTPFPKHTIKKVTYIALWIFLVIPGTVVGICLKKILYNTNPSFREKHKHISLFITRQQLSKTEETQTLTETQKDTSDKSLVIKAEGNRSKKIYKNYVVVLDDLSFCNSVYYLGLSETIKLKELNKNFFIKITNNNSKFNFFALYKTRLPSLKNQVPCSFNQITQHYQQNIQQYAYTPELIALFGGVENILRLPIVYKGVTFNKEKFYNNIETFAHGEDFRSTPAIFRLQIKTPEKEFMFILIKYSLFLPIEAINYREEDSQKQYKNIYDVERNDVCSLGPCGFRDTGKFFYGTLGLRYGELEGVYGLQGDVVWHDYVWLEYGSTFNEDTCKYVNCWKVVDPRFNSMPTLLNPSPEYRRSLPFPIPRYPPLNFKSLQNLPKSQSSSGIFTNSYQIRDIHYIYGKTKNYTLHTGRVFKNLPVFPGHIPIEKVFKGSEIVNPKKFADFSIDSSGNIISTGRTSNKLTKIISFNTTSASDDWFD